MMSSIYSGVSGIKAQQSKLSVIGNNIANVNTLGYKGQTAGFADLLSQTIRGASAGNAASGRGGTNPMQIGLGVGMSSISMLMTPGSTQSTGNSRDVSISGDGFFIVEGGGKSKYQYTRAGNFGVDVSGNLTVNGYKVCGWDKYTVNADGTYNYDTESAVEPLNLFANGKKTLAPKASTKSTLSGSINSSATSQGTAATIGSKTVATANNTGLNDVTKLYGTPDTVTINGTNISIAATDTISSIISNINAQTATTGVTATWNTGDGTNGYIQLTKAGNPAGTVNNITLDANNSTLTKLFAATSSTSLGTVSASGSSKISSSLGTAANATTNATGLTAAGTASAAQAGDIKINGTTITIADGDTITQLINKINAQTAATGVTAAWNAGDGTNGFIQLNSTTAGSTSKINLSGNNAALTDIFAATTSTTDTSASASTTTKADSSTTLLVYDKLGNSYNVQVNLYKADTSTTDPDNPTTTWYWEADTADKNLSVNGSGYIQFDKNGKILTTSYPATSSIKITPANSNAGTAPFDISLAMGDLTSYASTGTDSLTNTTDGYKSGSLDDFSITSDGVIVGSYDNGQTQSLGVIGLAKFTNSGGLDKIGDNLYTTTVNSGEFTGGVTAGSAGTGGLSAGTLEMSNVDLSEQFSEMMITQRAYQANSKIISASDECLQAVINMVR
ncbi:hypothetical protein SRRS_09510 [Sporomusa rhizae]|uniref:flagellar hook-basal body complex protein n=1 Tax=Sporomusa rhizae TaxID=357999 RepID=UPI00352B6103